MLIYENYYKNIIAEIERIVKSFVMENELELVAF